MNRQHGFTLIELMITLGIAAILLSVAVPSFNTTIKNNRLVTHTNLLVSSIGLARSEAVKHGRTATVCINANQPAVDCTVGNNWELGWMVWVDLNNNNAPDAGEERKFVQPFPAGTTLTSAVSRLNFTAQGAATADTRNRTLDLCDNRTGETGRQIGISATGRASTTRNLCA